MRYMGALGAPLADCVVFPLSVQREMVETARSFSDECARPIVAQANATPLGARENTIRICLGALSGVVVGIVATKLMGR